jgi:hypothetical protein
VKTVTNLQAPYKMGKKIVMDDSLILKKHMSMV